MLSRDQVLDENGELKPKIIAGFRDLFIYTIHPDQLKGENKQFVMDCISFRTQEKRSIMHILFKPLGKMKIYRRECYNITSVLQEFSDYALVHEKDKNGKTAFDVFVETYLAQGKSNPQYLKDVVGIFLEAGVKPSEILRHGIYKELLKNKDFEFQLAMSVLRDLKPDVFEHYDEIKNALIAFVGKERSNTDLVEIFQEMQSRFSPYEHGIRDLKKELIVICNTACEIKGKECDLDLKKFNEMRYLANLSSTEHPNVLFFLASRSYIAASELLRSAKITWQRKNKNRNTLEKFYKVLIKTLTDHGADPNLQDKNGETPVIVATEHYASECVVGLLNAGAKFDEETEEKYNKLIQRQNSFSWRMKKIVKCMKEAGIELKSYSYWEWMCDYLKSLAEDKSLCGKLRLILLISCLMGVMAMAGYLLCSVASAAIVGTSLMLALDESIAFGAIATVGIFVTASVRESYNHCFEGP